MHMAAGEISIDHIQYFHLFLQVILAMYHSRILKNDRGTVREICREIIKFVERKEKKKRKNSSYASIQITRGLQHDLITSNAKLFVDKRYDNRRITNETITRDSPLAIRILISYHLAFLSKLFTHGTYANQAACTPYLVVKEEGCKRKQYDASRACARSTNGCT